MDKTDIFKILAVIVVLGFITELFFINGGYINLIGSGVPSDTNVTGSATFNGTIRTYDPLLVIEGNTSSSIIDSLRKRSDVSDVSSVQGYYVIKTQTRDDVFPIATYLRSLNVTPYGYANVAAAQVITVNTAFGQVNTTVQGGVIKVFTEPLLDSGNDVTVSMTAVVNNYQIIDSSNAQILVQQVSFQLPATVTALDRKEYTFLIPWAQRNSLGNLSVYSYNYTRVDSMVFQSPLNTTTIITKKQFPYITYIDSGSAQFDPSFDNLTQLNQDFQDVAFELPPSQLTIYTNGTPDLPYNYTVQYSYDILPANSTQYGYSPGPMIMLTSKEYNVNDSLNITFTGLALGNSVVSITRVSLPS